MRTAARVMAIVGVLSALALASGCHSASAPLSSWHQELVLTFDGHEYQVTNVETNNVGGKIGDVVYHGRSYVYELYSIKGVDDYAQIAVRTKDGFLIANVGKPVSP